MHTDFKPSVHTPCQLPENAGSSAVGSAIAPGPWTRPGWNLPPDGETGVDTDREAHRSLYLTALGTLLWSGSADEIEAALEWAPPTGGIHQPAFRNRVLKAIARRPDEAGIACLHRAWGRLVPNRNVAALLEEAVASKDSQLMRAAVLLDPCAFTSEHFASWRTNHVGLARLALALRPELEPTLPFQDSLQAAGFKRLVVDPIRAGDPGKVAAALDQLVRRLPHRADAVAALCDTPALWQAALDVAPLPHQPDFWSAIVRLAPELLLASFRQRPDAIDVHLLITLVRALNYRLLRAACDARPQAVQEVNDNGQTAAHFAVGLSPFIALPILVDHGADLHLADRYNFVPARRMAEIMEQYDRYTMPFGTWSNYSA